MVSALVLFRLSKGWTAARQRLEILNLAAWLTEPPLTGAIRISEDVLASFVVVQLRSPDTMGHLLVRVGRVFRVAQSGGLGTRTGGSGRDT